MVFNAPSSSRRRRGSLSSAFSTFKRTVLLVVLATLSSRVSLAQSPVTLDTSEALFTVLTAINTCGYDAELAPADPVRMAIRGEIGHNIETSERAKTAVDAVCSFYSDHKQKIDALPFSEYISLGLYLNPPPVLSLKAKESDLPPD